MDWETLEGPMLLGNKENLREKERARKRVRLLLSSRMQVSGPTHAGGVTDPAVNGDISTNT